MEAEDFVDELDMEYHLFFPEGGDDSMEAEDTGTELAMAYSLFFPEEEDAEEASPSALKRTREKKNGVYTTELDGTRRLLKPRESVWFSMYVENPMCGDQRFEKKFRRSFRLPYTSFRELWLMLENSDAFSRWKEGSRDAANVEASPISLLLLCCVVFRTEDI